MYVWLTPLKYRWLRITTDIHATVHDSQQCGKRGPWRKNQRHLTLLLPGSPVEFIAVDILGSFFQRRNENEYENGFIIAGWISILSQAIRTAKTSTSYVAKILFGNWLIPYGIVLFLRTDNGQKLVFKMFGKVCLDLMIRYLTTTAHQPQKNGRVKRYNGPFIIRLNHHISDHQKN